MVNVHIHHFAAGRGIVDAEALKVFQAQWAIYQKLVDSNVLSHAEVGRILHDVLTERFATPFSFLDIACGDASLTKAALAGTCVRHYHGIDLAGPAIDLAATNLAGEPFEVDLERIMRAALERGCFLELNAQPDRLDLNDVHCHMAKELGLKHTKFVDASGLRGNQSTAREIALALRVALEDKVLREIMGTSEATIVSKDRSARIDYHTTNVPLAHRFQILSGSTVVAEFRTSGTTWAVDANLNENTTYNWRARGEQGGSFGPWSETWTFTTPEQPEGYIRGNELYDPLFNGRTVGQIVGPVTFIPGVGAKIEGPASYIQYNLPQTLTGGEFSILVTNMRTNTEGDKTKVMAMAEGDADITTNDRRFTIEKRGNPPGVIAWRVLTSNQQIDTVGAERVRREFDPNQTYFWRASWGNNRFDLLIKSGGVSGNTIYSFGKNYRGVYDPNPHRAYIGGPAGRAGLDSGSVDGMIVRQVWISSRPRPSFANK